ncbi:MICOS complex subunit MIC27 [Brachionichthys hirsutus]|uniref:MICOS complex subunit MIC27 n=1 Tax=Brachionichthys hirsutus TaxID=412623 RepID=UPI0036051418
MAAKVVMVAVPTVLGIASIRVYTVEEAPADGMASREKLNFYTQLPPSGPAHFVPARPGLIQSGVTAAREGVLPLVQAVKGACFSLKSAAVNVRHAGEDVYYYLKDPPPDFLPRFGTITMAGLLGMFLSRKGSRFKRVAVPLGLMSAGASVCYPAQTVAVVKVAGKKLYAAGRWSSGATASLLTTEPQEPPPSPQAAAVPGSDSAPASAVLTEEASSVTHSEQSPAQTPPGHGTDPVAQSAPREMKSFMAAEEIPAPVASETKPAAGASPGESIPPSEPEELQPAPLETAEVPEAVPLEPASGEAVPLEPASSEAVPLEPASGEDVPGEAAALESVPSAEEPSGPKVSHDPSDEPEPLPPAESADPPRVAAAEDSKGGAVFKPEPSLMDFGQSSAEEEDLYSTRS